MGIAKKMVMFGTLGIVASASEFNAGNRAFFALQLLQNSAELALACAPWGCSSPNCVYCF